MAIDSARTRPSGQPSTTANDRFKRGWSRSLWSATALGAIFHAGLLFYTPEVEVQSVDAAAEPAQLVQLVSIAELAFAPPPPDVPILRPRLPTMAELNLDISLDPTLILPEFDDFVLDAEELAPPIQTEQNEWLDYKHFAPFVVRPEIRNRTELKRFLQRNYQPIYEYSGATGVVQVSFWINEGGQVEKAEIVKSSGSRSLDRLALRISRVFQFRPAMLAGRPVRILVHVPITFRAA